MSLGLYCERVLKGVENHALNEGRFTVLNSKRIEALFTSLL